MQKKNALPHALFEAEQERLLARLGEPTDPTYAPSLAEFGEDDDEHLVWHALQEARLGLVRLIEHDRVGRVDDRGPDGCTAVDER